MYKKQWTDFETQSLAFGTLRKSLYPNYLVRGETGVIRIYRPTVDTSKPELILTITVKSSDSAAQSGFFETDRDCFHLVGGDTAYKIMEHITPLLNRGR